MGDKRCQLGQNGLQPTVGVGISYGPTTEHYNISTDYSEYSEFLIYYHAQTFIFKTDEFFMK